MTKSINIKNTVSDTAFLTNWARALHPDISNDPWANLWVTDRTKKIGEEFQSTVSPYESYLTSLRNRYFLEDLKMFFLKNEGVFCNIASGFTSYSWQLPENIECYEIDLPNVLSFKKSRIEEWQIEGKFPKRPVHFAPLDLSNKEDFKKFIAGGFGSKPIYFLLEGVLYYLDQSVVHNILLSIAQLPIKIIRIGLVYWSNEFSKTEVFQRMSSYFRDTYQIEVGSYTIFERDFFEKIQGLKITESTNFIELGKKYAPDQDFQKPKIFEETFLILERK